VDRLEQLRLAMKERFAERVSGLGVVVDALLLDLVGLDHSEL
jgi:hypothetical protein